MFDSSKMYPNGFHSANIDQHSTFKDSVKAHTSVRPSPRYYFTGLELSVQYSSRDTMDEPWHRGDESAPEHRSGRRCNPFHTDIYYIGNFVRQEFMKVGNHVSCFHD